jgi:hypothetical protein
VAQLHLQAGVTSSTRLDTSNVTHILLRDTALGLGVPHPVRQLTFPPTVARDLSDPLAAPNRPRMTKAAIAGYLYAPLRLILTNSFDDCAGRNRKCWVAMVLLVHRRLMF